MNPLSPEQVILTSFNVALQAAYPARKVTRSLKDFADRKREDIVAGVYTIVSDGLPSGDVYMQMMKFIVVCQIKLDEKATGEEVENIELAMMREVRNLIQRKLQGPDMKVTRADQSAQLEVPYAWVSLHVECGPYDATEPLTVDETVGNLADFLTFKADIDVTDSHRSAEEHHKWVAEPPNYSTSQPDAQMRVDIPRS
jgi:hypothetical protein